MIRFVHIRNSPNCGDLASCPADYFDFGKDVEIYNYSDDVPAGGTVVYGGGTMVNWLNMGGRPTGRINILWGAGSSRREQVDPWPDPEGFDLVGLREWTPEREAMDGRYVPCVSCMSRLFDRGYRPTREAVRFVNAERAITQGYCMDASDLPTMTNASPLETVIPFLASGEVVVTNSYHGAFWATLLGRKVVCVPYSSKFHWFKFPPAMSDSGNDWRRKAEQARVYPEALEDCRRVNREFYRRVMEVAG